MPADGGTPSPIDSAQHPELPFLDGADAWLVGDIGGTRARFGRLTAQGVPYGTVRLANDDFADLPQVLRAALDQTGPTVSRLALAVACPIDDGPIRLTNRDWTFDAASLRRAAGAAEVRLVNDFAAAAAGLAALQPHEVTIVADPTPDPAAAAPDATAAGLARRPSRPGAVRIVLGPGTGLGLAAVVRCGLGWRVLGSEAGHVGCATTEADAMPALAEARREWGRVSWERLLCGDGLARLDAALREAPPRAPAQVAADAQAAEPIARRAANAFSRLLGEFAGDACLMLGAEAVYLTGGVLSGLGDAFNAQAFRRGFEDKGRFAPRMRAVPAWHVTAKDLALRGLAQIVAGAAEAAGTADPPPGADGGMVENAESSGAKV